MERKLGRRSDTRATLGSTRRREVEYRISVANHTPRPATVEVRDQLPVSRDDGVAMGFRVELAKGVELAGWRE